jgi:hypothetical protein
MPASPQFRMAVGSPTGRRSTTWKFIVNKNNVYIVSGMFEGGCKISLHESGDCQFSRNDPWVRQEPGRRNADRHITKWQSPRMSGGTATHVFQIRIPEDDLAAFTADEDLTPICWLPAPRPGNAVLFECYLTGPADSDPTVGVPLPFLRLFALQLVDLRWFVVLHRHIPSDEAYLQRLRQELFAEARSHGVTLSPTHRMSAMGPITAGAMMFIELCPALL